MIVGRTLVETADAIAAGTVSAREVVEACLSQIETQQPRLNCFISVDADDARAAADAADAAQARGDALGPLHGVPLAHKDLFYRVGRVATCASKIRRGMTSDVTATAVARLEAAGAITVGSLNMAEFAIGPTGHNRTGAIAATRGILRSSAAAHRRDRGRPSAVVACSARSARTPADRSGSPLDFVALSA